MDSAVHLGLELSLLWETYWAGASRYTTSSSDPHYFCRALQFEISRDPKWHEVREQSVEDPRTAVTL